MSVNRSDRSTSSRFVPHELEWSPEHVRRFWDYLSTNPAFEHLYFTRLLGKALVRYVRSRIGLGTVVDIGCGRGDLIEEILATGHEVYAVDQSPASIDHVLKQFAAQSRFKGAALFDGKIGIPDESVDSAFIVEVVEHLDDESLANSLGEAHRILRPGGHLIITTPNQEDLRRTKTMCPECGSVFHTMQHVRAWSASSLSDRVNRSGFAAVSCRPTILSPYGGPMAWIYRLAYQAVRRHKPHLIYIGRRL